MVGHCCRLALNRLLADTHVAIKLGMEATLNYKDGGQAGAGSWNELTNTKDVTLSLEAGEA